MSHKEIAKHATLESLTATTNCDIVWIFTLLFPCVNKYIIHIRSSHAKKSCQYIINIELHFRDIMYSNIFKNISTNYIHIMKTRRTKMFNDEALSVCSISFNRKIFSPLLQYCFSL